MPVAAQATELNRSQRGASEQWQPGHLVVAAAPAPTLTGQAEMTSPIKDDFLAAVAHDIRSPLSAVLGWVRILESTLLPQERAAEAIAAIRRNASAIAHLIDDLLDTSRILNGAIRLARQRVDLVAVVQEAIDTLRPLATSRSVQLRFEAVAGPGTVIGDPDRLQQVMWNLLSNAIKFTPAGGNVNVFVTPMNDWMEVKVADTGRGLSADFLPHVFERFRQAPDATTQRHTGLGLGLGIVRQLVELHGGTVHAASPGLDQGATFTLRLPVSGGPQQARAALRAGG